MICVWYFVKHILGAGMDVELREFEVLVVAVVVVNVIIHCRAKLRKAKWHKVYKLFRQRLSRHLDIADSNDYLKKYPNAGG